MSDLVGTLKAFSEIVIGELQLPRPVKVLLLDANTKWLVKLVSHGQLDHGPTGVLKIDVEKSPEIDRRKPPYQVVFDADGINAFARDFPWDDEHQTLNLH